MTTPELTRTKGAAPGRGSTVRYYLGGRRGLLVAGTAIAVAGLAFNWAWLVAAGIAPLLLGVLPCVAMCALGLCVNRLTGRSCPAEDTSPKADEVSDGPTTTPTNLKGNA